MRFAPAILAVVFLVAHARALPNTLEDEDSINFALGVESFDVAAHRPHPPGYPVYIAAARGSTAAVTAIAPSWDRDRRAATGLAIWSVVAGALAAIVLTAFWVAAGLSHNLAFFAALVGVASPLFWFSASRPLTDVPGLVAALAVQTLLIRGWRAMRANRGWREIRDGAATLPREWLWGVAAAAFVIGIRSQAMWLNGPLIAWGCLELLRRRRPTDVMRVAGWGLAGVLVWAVPMLWDSGVTGYLQSLQSQGAQDAAGVPMLVTSATRALFDTAIDRTFVVYWLTKNFARVMLLLALVGIVRLGWKRRDVLGAVAITFLPYLVYHLLLQEVIFIRYALPVALAVSGLFVIGAGWIHERAAAVAAIAAAVVAIVLTQPRLDAYATGGWPVHRAFQDMIRARPASGEGPLVRTHHQVWHGVQRIFDWYRPIWDVGPQPFPKDREWLDVVRHWQTGTSRTVWFLGDLTRNDLMLFDPRATRLGGRYQTTQAIRQVVGGETRLDGLNWWILERPFWMLGTGWSLTPEIAGMTKLDGLGPHIRPAEAFLARTSSPSRVLIGGRYLEPGGTGPATVSVDLDGRRLREWTVSASQPWFVEWIELPDGVPPGAGTYATLTVSAASTAPGGPAPWVGLEQFDAAPIAQPILALTSGWQELEHEPTTGRTWRWTSARSTLTVRGGTTDVRLLIEGESPLKNFDRAPTVVVRAGTREIARFRPASDFSESIVIPSGLLSDAAGEVTLETDLTFVPGERGNTPDRRQLGLKLYKVEMVR